MQRHRRRRGSRTVIGFTSVAATLVLAACGGSSNNSNSTAKPAGNVLRVAVAQSPDPFDPATLGDNRTIELSQNVFDGLTDIDPNTLKTVPALAASYQVSSNGETYTFHLRAGAKFQNGDPVTAQDFVYSWNRTLSPKVASPYAFFLSGIQGSAAVTAGKAKTASGIKALGPLTLQVVLSQPAGYFAELVSRWPFWAVDPKVVAANPHGWFNPPTIIGTGAYRLTNEVGQQEYDFKANPSYFAGAPSISQIKVSVVPDPTSRVARFQAGEFDAVFGLNAAALREVDSNPSLKADLHTRPQLGTTWMGMNNTKPPFNNVKVREAFSDAINRADLVRVALGGLGRPTGTFLPPGLPGAIANTPAASSYGKYEPSQAKALLAQAGYPNGHGFPSVTLYTDDVAADQTVAQLIQAQLSSNLNVNIGLRAMPQNSFQALFNSPKTAPSLYNYSFSLDYPDAQEMLEYFATSGPNGFVNYEDYKNPAFDALIARATATLDSTQRAQLYNQAETMFMADSPVVPLYNQVVAWLVKPYVHGIGQSAQYMMKWKLGSL